MTWVSWAYFATSWFLVGCYALLVKRIIKWMTEMHERNAILQNEITQLQLDIDVSRVMHGHEPRYFTRTSDPKEGS